MYRVTELNTESFLLPPSCFFCELPVRQVVYCVHCQCAIGHRECVLGYLRLNHRCPRCRYT